MLLTLFKGKTTITEARNLPNREFRALMRIRSKELEEQAARDAEAGDELEEAMEGG